VGGPAVEQSAVGPPSFLELTCDCGKGPFKSKAGLVSHKRWCNKKNPDAQATNQKPRPIKIDAAYSRSDATEGAQRAKAALIGDPAALEGAASGDVRSIGKIVSRLSQGHVGVPEIGALACETALPPPLKETEYVALCAVWGDEALDIPPNMLKFLVTASIFGPRLLTHETIGPAIKRGAAKLAARFGIGAPEEPAPAPAPAYRPPPPVAAAAPVAPAPAPPTNNKPTLGRDEPEPSPAWADV
jgi:hypothetical protein